MIHLYRPSTHDFVNLLLSGLIYGGVLDKVVEKE
jgi:hypothetical protein